MGPGSTPKKGRKPTKKASLRTPEDAIALGIKDARQRRGWTQQDLADRLAAIGYPLDRSTLAKLEATKKPRGISVNDALAIAAALGIAPVHLFTGLAEERIAIADDLDAEAWQVRAWIRGRRGPLPGAPGDTEEESRAYEDIVPPREKELRGIQVFNDVELLSFHIVEALDWRTAPGGVPEWLTSSIEEDAADIQKNSKKFVRDIQRPSPTSQDIRP